MGWTKQAVKIFRKASEAAIEKKRYIHIHANKEQTRLLEEENCLASRLKDDITARILMSIILSFLAALVSCYLHFVCVIAISAAVVLVVIVIGLSLYFLSSVQTLSFNLFCYILSKKNQDWLNNKKWYKKLKKEQNGIAWHILHYYYIIIPGLYDESFLATQKPMERAD